jgi:hypothetical protein
MKVRSLRLNVVAMVTLLAALSGCSKAPVRTDAHVATEVQSKIASDSRINSREIGVRTDNGVVTLSGNVGSEDERASAASDAATVDGVRTVVNNLVVEQAQAPLPAEETPATAPARQATGKTPPKRREATRSVAAQQGAKSVATANADNGSLPPSNQPAPPPAPAVAQAPLPPPPPKKFTIPAGTQLTVRLNDPLDTIVINDETVIPSGADVVGHVVDVKSAGRFAGSSVLTLELNSLSVNGRTYNVQTSQWSRQGKGEGKNTAVKAGGGAAIGAIIGGLAGGGKGAAIGSVAGAGAGTGAAATKKGEQIKLAPESTLSFLLINTLTVTRQSSNNRNAGRAPLQ